MAVTTSGAITVRADRATVFAALHDVDCLKRCLLGCRSLVRASDTLFVLVVEVPLGPLRIAFNGEVRVVESAAPTFLRLQASGEAGVAGLASGSARIALAAAPQGTRLTYDVNVAAVGRLRGPGLVLIKAAAVLLTQHFVTAFSEVVNAITVLPAPVTQARLRSTS